MKIHNPNNIIRFKSNYYIICRFKIVNYVQKYKTKQPILVIENEPILLGDSVCVYNSEKKDDIKDDVYVSSFFEQNENNIIKFIDYPSQNIIDMYNHGHLKHNDYILIYGNYLFGNHYYINEEPLYCCKLDEYNLKESFLEKKLFDYFERL